MWTIQMVMYVEEEELYDMWMVQMVICEGGGVVRYVDGQDGDVCGGEGGFIVGYVDG